MSPLKPSIILIDPISFCLLFQLLYYSAHYPTIFSLFSALGLKEAANSPLRRIPYYASLVFFELLRDSYDDKFVVQFSFKNGLEVSVEVTIFRFFASHSFLASHSFECRMMCFLHSSFTISLFSINVHTSVLLQMPSSDWLHYSVSILL